MTQQSFPSPATVGRKPGRQEFLFIDVCETDETSRFWADSAYGAKLGNSSIWALPEHDADGTPFYPADTTGFIERLRAALPAEVTVGHVTGLPERDDVDCWPKLLARADAWDQLMELLGQRLADLEPDPARRRRTTATIIIETEAGRALQVRYAGGPQGLAQAFSGLAPHFLPAISVTG